MEKHERREAILKMITDDYSVKVAELSQRLYVSEATIRRDLERMEKSGHLKRVYGGAVRMESVDTESPVDVRRGENAKSKETIARLACTLVSNGSILALDSSTTSLYLCAHLKSYENLTVLTHGVKQTEELLRYKNINLYSAGGLILRNTYSLSGEFTRRFFASFYTDAVFFSCKGLSMEHGPSWAYDEEAALREVMLKNTRRRVLLCDHTKFDRTYASILFGFESVDIVITDRRPSEAWESFFRKKNVTVICP